MKTRKKYKPSCFSILQALENVKTLRAAGNWLEHNTVDVHTQCVDIVQRRKQELPCIAQYLFIYPVRSNHDTFLHEALKRALCKNMSQYGVFRGER